MSTLHLTDTGTTVHARQCARLSSTTDDPNLIVVALAGSPARWLAQWERVADADPDRVTVVVDDDASWIAGRSRDRIASAAGPDTEVCVESVGSPGNLTDLGVTLTELLAEHEEFDPPTTLCFQSATVLLQYSRPDAVFRFLHTLFGHLDGFDATGHVHLHADAHDPETIASLRPLFDRVAGDAA